MAGRYCGYKNFAQMNAQKPKITSIKKKDFNLWSHNFERRAQLLLRSFSNPNRGCSPRIQESFREVSRWASSSGVCNEMRPNSATWCIVVGSYAWFLNGWLLAETCLGTKGGYRTTNSLVRVRESIQLEQYYWDFGAYLERRDIF